MPAAHHVETLLSWLIRSTGVFGLLAALIGIVFFVFTVRIARQGDGTAVGAVLIRVIPVPLVVGFVGFVSEFSQTFSVMSSNARTYQLLPELADGFACALVPPFVGLLFSLPSYIAATAILISKSLRHTERAAERM